MSVMKLTHIATLAAALRLTMAEKSGFVDRAKYTSSFAAGELQRIEAYRTNKGDTLTGQQSKYLDIVAGVVKSFDTANVERVASGCEAIFGKQECGSILFGQATGGLVANLPPLVCSCSDESAYCPAAHYCKYKAYDCAFTENGGCGFLGMYVCNGVCYPSY